ncbi:MAG: acyl-CoA dehydrogenase family protein [Chloroflexota bacterium]
MDFELSEEQQMLRKMVRDFAEKEVAPKLASVKEGEPLPPEIRKSLADLGLLGMCLPAEYGGDERPVLDAVLAIEELIQVSNLVSIQVMEANTGPARIVERYALPEVKAQVLPGVAKGEITISPGMTEAEAGSALTDLQTKAVLQGDHYVVNGAKLFQHTDADYFLTYVRLTEDKGARGIGALLIGKDYPGISVGSPQEFMGLKSPRGEIVYDNCIVPKENLVVNAGDFRNLIDSFNLERCGNAASCLGLAQRALTLSQEYSRQRKAFGREICEFQAVQFMLADMALKVEAARLLLYRAAVGAGRGFPSPLEANLAKCFANEMVRDVTGLALQLHGGYGYSKEYVIEKIFRDGWGWGVAGGTVQMQKITIASQLLGRSFPQRV